MTSFRMKLIGTGLAIGLLVIPVAAGAEAAVGHTNHRIFTQEAIERMQYEPTAGYMMLERSPLEEIAGRDNLDWETIVFLEENLWDYDYRAEVASVDPDLMSEEELWFWEQNTWDYEDSAEPAGESDGTRTGVFAIDPDAYSEEIFWQDQFEPAARFVGDADNTGGIYIDPGYYSAEVLGQDRDDDDAEFAETEAENLFPEADDVPQLRAGVLTY